MVISKKEIDQILSSYDKNKIKIGAICSHSSLQIFKGAREEGFQTIGILTNPEVRNVYKAFPKGSPDEFLETSKFSKSITNELLEKNVVLIPSGSLVEYFGESIMDLPIPLLGNRMSLFYEKNRLKMYEWLKKAGLNVPLILEPSKIDRPCVVKHSGAKGGRGYSIVHSPEEYYQKYGNKEGLIVQEFVVGVRLYPHYFYSPLSKDGYPAAEGHLELMSVDRRLESNVDESYRTILAGVPIKASFTVIGNEPVIIRESLLVDIFEMGKNVVETAYELFGPMPGPFCLELICDENLDFYVFEISARIVAGTNLFPEGSFYSCYNKYHMSTGQRIAREIKDAIALNALEKIFY
ncbi:MAG: formate--phosphoribosylaminoimidazolecarboxamide ligase [Candidatus Micrarchaeota archaeon]|nr:formate--phosphoribosylaminoimidazolecarboxamide ligase [Candidatus Micrarchaeota archaeon]